MAKVHVDFGHGGKDPGALGNGMQEKDINLAVGLKVGKILEQHKVLVTYSRKTDIFVDLTSRATMANNTNADIFVSIHCNAFSNPQAVGLETLYNKGSVKGKQLAQTIQDSLLSNRLYNVDRGLKERDNVTVLIKTKMPAALVEMGFITNVSDAQILINKQDELAESIAKGILNFLGIKYVENKVETKKEKELDIIKFNLHGKELAVEGIYENDTNYIPIRFLEQLGYSIDWKNGTVFINYKEVK